MAIVVESSTGNTSSATALEPSGAVQGDLLLLFFIHSSGTPTSIDAIFTQMYQSTIDDVVRTTAFWGIRGAGAPDLSSTGGGTYYSSHTFRLSGHHATAPVGTVTVEFQASAGTHEPPSINLAEGTSAAFFFCDVPNLSGVPSWEAGNTAIRNLVDIVGSAYHTSPSDPTSATAHTVTFPTSGNTHIAAIEVKIAAAAGGAPSGTMMTMTGAGR